MNPINKQSELASKLARNVENTRKPAKPLSLKPQIAAHTGTQRHRGSAGIEE